MILLLETLLALGLIAQALGFHSHGGAHCGERHSALEIECGNLFCLLEQGENELQHLHAGLPLEPCCHLAPSICVGDGRVQCHRAEILFPPE